MKFVRHRRGLSNVVTMAMLLTGVTVMGTGLVAWSHGNLNAFQVELANTTSTVTNKINENLAIETVVFCKGCNTPPFSNANTIINVTLTNTGTLAVKVIKIQINSTTIQTYFYSTSLPASILPQRSYTVSTILPNLPSQMYWDSKSLDTITITTARGSIFTTQVAAP